ncbi:hypothetical protein BFG07_00885 [Kosakonia cowanii]|nr:hypothetical protein BFG07_00885 [Kosakonia cowanii]
MYSITVGDGSDNIYSAECSGDETSGEQDYFYAAKYAGNYDSTGEGFVKLNDFIDVRTSIFIASHDFVTVPFTDVDNFSPQRFNTIEDFHSGDQGKVDIRLRKTIFNGTIDIPAFSVNLYARFGPAGAYNNKPLTVIHFKESKIDVKALCKVSPLSFGKSDISSRDAENKIVAGSQVLNISCDTSAEDGMLYLTFKGIKFAADSRYFLSKMPEVGIGIKNNAGEYITPNSRVKVEVTNGKAEIPLNFVGYFKKHSGSPSIHNTASVEIQTKVDVGQ